VRHAGLRSAGIVVVLLDIEGTTTPIAFVHDVLFPFARARARAWFAERDPSDPDVQEVVNGLRQELDAECSMVDTGSWTVEATLSHLFALMDQDRKSPALKNLQGKIWQEGYRSGALSGEVYADVPGALERWTAAGVQVGIFSSGSVLAQKLLFGHSNAGDLTRFLRWHFDTSAGPKIDAASYRRIVGALGVRADQVLFISDVARELDAARDAGLQTLLCARDPLPPASHAVITTFDDVPA
jgi:enolase-phosphatase E1